MLYWSIWQESISGGEYVIVVHIYSCWLQIKLWVRQNRIMQGFVFFNNDQSGCMRLRSRVVSIY